MAQRRNSVSDKLIETAISKKDPRRQSWLDALSDDDKLQIRKAADKWSKSGRPWARLAEAVKEHYKVKVSVRVITDFLKGMPCYG